MEALLEPSEFERHAKELRESWQGRVLAAAKGQTGAVVLSVLAHNFDGAILTLCQVVFPGFSGIEAPFMCSAAKVNKAGWVVADVAMRDGRIAKDAKIFASEIELRDEMRRLADRIKLSDADRVQFFAAVQKWVVADQRLDPTMNPMDPDAKRLVH